MWRRTWLVFSQAVTVAIAVLFVVVTFKPEWLPRSAASRSATLPAPTVVLAQPAAGAASAAPMPTGFSTAARRASPAVVSIVTTRQPGAAGGAGSVDPHLEFFFGQRPNQPMGGLGSGVIVSPEGYVLTNLHVIDGASEIEVQLADGRQTAARLVGSDADTDLAVLKIDLDRLPVIAFGDVSALQVGDAVLAIGNPFDVGQTVTAGIVSATGRSGLRLSTYENFIQTDAAINPGNSGGALVDARGDLMGINTAIFERRGGGNLGIGFAIPADTARQVMEGLIRDGQVVRGWIGVETRPLTAEFAESFGLPVRQGALITGVLQDGAANKAGIRPGDVVLRVNETAIANPTQLMAAVAALKPGSQARIQVQRGPKALDLATEVAQRPAPSARRR